ncbi:hypothetical protein [Dongia deserti]|uniref:hypothetical protein n=1 Tax=Dongia deserti TaxID=2268030 RepID=UPI0013C3FAD6|nr:hypothetical protein [Dongia deserti]
MLRPVTTSSASASAAPVAVHASAAANLSTNRSGATTVGVTQSAQSQTGNAEQMFRYNSFEFVYRQDIGRIVLIGQSPETGERVIQVPSEQALRAYERTARVERQARIQEGQAPAKPTTPTPIPTPAPDLATALVAAVGGANNGSGVISVSA